MWQVDNNEKVGRLSFDANLPFIVLCTHCECPIGKTNQPIARGLTEYPHTADRPFRWAKLWDESEAINSQFNSCNCQPGRAHFFWQDIYTRP